VLDPAMGSGHFLVAALEYLATAYWEALNREGQDDDGIMSDEEFILCKRRVAERCIYGVDINPLAVELGKLSIWLTTMDKERPLSFLNHHLKSGNSLVGAWIKDLGMLPGSRAQPRQGNLFEHHFKARVPLMVRDVLRIMSRDTLSIHDVRAKRALDQAVEQTKAPFVKIANAWVATYFGEQARDYDALITDLSNVKDRTSPAAKSHTFFHWELAFPEVWYDADGSRKDQGGFHAVVGNPPYYGKGQSSEDAKTFWSHRYPNQEYQSDLYLLFIELAIQLCSTGGRYGVICPNTLLSNLRLAALRKHLLESSRIDHLVHFFYYVFGGATVDVMILIAQIAEQEASNVRDHGVTLRTSAAPNSYVSGRANQGNWLSLSGAQINIFIPSAYRSVIADVEAGSAPLSYYYTVKAGVKPYEVGKGIPPQTREMVSNRVYDADHKKAEGFVPYLRGSDIYRFRVHWKGDHWIKYGANLAAPRSSELFFVPHKIVVRQTGDSIVAAVDEKGFVCLNNLHVAVPNADTDICPWYVLGVINSDIQDFFYFFLNPEKGEGLAEVKKFNVEKLRIPPPDQDRSIAEMISNISRSFVSGRDYDGEAREQLTALVAHMFGLTQNQLDYVTRRRKNYYDVSEA
jgi:hypothetical protein